MTQVSRKFRGEVISLLYALKHNKPCRAASIIPIHQDGQVTAVLRVVSDASLKEAPEIKRLALWRDANSTWFPSQFRVSVAGTKKWGKEQLLEKKDRILFMIEDLKGIAIGHVGLYTFDYDKYSCEIDNIIRGEKGVPGVMTAAIDSLCRWGRDVLGVKTFTLRCFADNAKAIALYRRSGFVEFAKIPLVQVQKKRITVWEEPGRGVKLENAKRYFVCMERVGI